MGFLEPLQQRIYEHMGYNQSRTYKRISGHSANVGHS